MSANYDLDWDFEIDEDTAPVLAHPVMQSQRQHKQLGQVEAIFSKAVHTRYEHSGYTGRIADKICKVLNKKGRLPSSKKDIVHFAVLHDIGHPPFSHAVEYVLKEFTGIDHNQRAIDLLYSDIRDNEGRIDNCVIYST